MTVELYFTVNRGVVALIITISHTETVSLTSCLWGKWSVPFDLNLQIDSCDICWLELDKHLENSQSDLSVQWALPPPSSAVQSGHQSESAAPTGLSPFFFYGYPEGNQKHNRSDEEKGRQGGDECPWEPGSSPTRGHFPIPLPTSLQLASCLSLLSYLIKGIKSPKINLKKKKEIINWNSHQSPLDPPQESLEAPAEGPRACKWTQCVRDRKKTQHMCAHLWEGNGADRQPTWVWASLPLKWYKEGEKKTAVRGRFIALHNYLAFSENGVFI